MNSLKENRNASYEVVVRCPHSQLRLMDAEYIVARTYRAWQIVLKTICRALICVPGIALI
jgi:hypothetical protein